MFLGDRGDERDVWLGDVPKDRNFTRKAGADLYYGHVRLGRQREQGKWNTDAVVEISGCGVNGKRATEGSFDQVFRARLAIAPGDADYGLSPRASPVVSQRAERHECITNLEHGHVERAELGSFGNHNRRSSVTNGIRQIIVPVESLSAHRDEHVPL